MTILTTLTPNATPKDYAMQLHDAFSDGSGCGNSTVIKILARRNDEQRDHIRREYKNMYGHDIVERLDLVLSGDFKKLVLRWMPNPAERDAKLIRDSLTTAPFKRLTNVVFNTKPANEVLCSRTASTIQSIKPYYHSEFETTLENDIECHTYGDHQKILLALVTTPQCEGPEFDGMAFEDAMALYNARERGTRNDKDTFIRIFGKGSSAHLARVAFAYDKMYGTPLKKVIEKKSSGNFQQCLSIILQCAENPVAYFTEELHKSMKGMGTNDSALIRLIVSRAEIDLPEIKAEYEKKYKKRLQDAISSDTSGHYRDFLIALLG